MSKKQQNNNGDGHLEGYTIPSSTPVELYTHPSSPPQHWFRFAYDDINAFSPWLMRDENKVFMAYPLHDQELFGPYDDAAVKSNEGPLIAVPLHMVPIPYTLSDEDKDIFVDKLRDSLSELGVPKAKKIPAYVDLNEDAGMFKTLISKLAGPSTIDLLIFASDLTIQMGGEIKHGKTLDLTPIKDYTDSIVGDFAPTLNHWLSEVFSEEAQKSILVSLDKEVPKTQSGGFQVSMTHVLGAYLCPLSDKLVQSFERDVFTQLLQQLPKREGTPVVEPVVRNDINHVIDPEHVPAGAARRR